MKNIMTVATFVAMLASTAGAGPTTPNAKTYQNGITFAQFLAANGCTLVDMGGYSNAKGPDGGGCKAVVDWGRSGGGYLQDVDGAGPIAPEWVASDY